MLVHCMSTICRGMKVAFILFLTGLIKLAWTENAMDYQAVRKWLARFGAKNVSLADDDRSRNIILLHDMHHSLVAYSPVLFLSD